MYFSQSWPWVAPSALALVLSFQRCLLFSLPLFLALYYPVFLSLLKPQKKKSYKKIWSRQSNKSTWVMDGGARDYPSSSSRRCWGVWGQLCGVCVMKSYSCSQPSNISILGSWMSKKPRSWKRLPLFFGNGSRPLLKRLVEQNAFAFQGSGYSLKQELRVIWGASEDINTLISNFMQKCMHKICKLGRGMIWKGEWKGDARHPPQHKLASGSPVERLMAHTHAHLRHTTPWYL